MSEIKMEAILPESDLLAAIRKVLADDETVIDGDEPEDIDGGSPSSTSTSVLDGGAP